MIRPKLFDTVSTLTDDEWSSFGKYLQLHTRKTSDNFKAYKSLWRHRKEILDEGMADHLKRKYFESMSPKAYSNMLSRVFLWFEEWFAIEQFQNEKFEKKLLLVKGYNQRGLFKQANSIASQLEKEIKERDQLRLDHNMTLSRLYSLQYFSSNPIKQSKDSTLYHDCLNAFSKYISEQSSFYLLESINRNNQGKTKSPIDELLDNTVKHSKSSPLKDLLQSALSMLRDQDTHTVLALKGKLLESKIDKTSDLYLVLTYYLRINAAKLNTNFSSRILEHLLEIFRMSLDATSRNKHQKLLPTNLFNAINFIARISSKEETKRFIAEWVPKTTTAYPDSTLNYCHAINAFRHDNYDKIPHLINGLDFDEFNYKVISSAMLCIAYFELNEADITSTLILNLRKQIRRNQKKIHPNVFKGLLNFLEVIAHLQKSKYKTSNMIDLKVYDSLFFRAWIEKKIN